MPKGPYIDTKFEGIDVGKNNSIPPDCSGAAGPSSVIAVVNFSIEARNKAGSLLWTAPLVDFFKIAGITDPYDPKIVYDSHEKRFVVVTLDKNEPHTISFIFLAVSKNENPTSPSDWYVQKIDSLTDTTVNGLPVTTWADYPGFEVDEEAIYVTNQMINREDGKRVESRLWIVDKGISGGFYDGGNVREVASLPMNNSDGFNKVIYQPAEIRASDPTGAGPGIGTYLVAYKGQNPEGIASLHVVRINDPLGTPTLVQEFVNIGNIGDPYIGNLGDPDSDIDVPDAPQPEIVDKIATNDRRMLDAVWHNDELWCVFTIEKNGKSAAYWVKLTTNIPGALAAVMDLGSIDGDDIAGPETFTFFPSVAVNSRGIAAFGFSASAPSLYAGAYVTVRDDINDAPGTVQASEAVKEGVAPYKRFLEGDRNRWGDYSGISVDPVDDDCFWVYNQYADVLDCPVNPEYPDETGCWGTAWARLCVP
jgi:hypothetical protein